MSKNPNDYAAHAKNILKRQSEPKILTAAPSMSPMGASAGASVIKPPIVSAAKLINTMQMHPAVHQHISMHIQDRLKKLGG